MPFCLCATGGGTEPRVETTMQEVSDRLSANVAVTIVFMVLMFIVRMLMAMMAGVF